MLNIEYEIKLNETGRPYVKLSDDYEDKPEDKFFVLELTRYLLQNIYLKRSAEFDEEASVIINNCIVFLGQIGDETAAIIYNQMKTMGEVDMMLDKRYHIEIVSLEELNKLDNLIVYNNKIFIKQNGLKVLVGEDRDIYEYNEGNWEIVK